MLKWTEDRPTEPGYYVFKHAAQWPLYFVRVAEGNWKAAQNPVWLYCSGLPDHSANSDCRNGPIAQLYGKWFGPIPEPDTEF